MGTRTRGDLVTGIALLVVPLVVLGLRFEAMGTLFRDLVIAMPFAIGIWLVGFIAAGEGFLERDAVFRRDTAAGFFRPRIAAWTYVAGSALAAFFLLDADTALDRSPADVWFGLGQPSALDRVMVYVAPVFAVVAMLGWVWMTVQLLVARRPLAATPRSRRRADVLAAAAILALPLLLAAAQLVHGPDGPARSVSWELYAVPGWLVALVIAVTGFLSARSPFRSLRGGSLHARIATWVFVPSAVLGTALAGVSGLRHYIAPDDLPLLGLTDVLTRPLVVTSLLFLTAAVLAWLWLAAEWLTAIAMSERSAPASIPVPRTGVPD